MALPQGGRLSGPRRLQAVPRDGAEPDGGHLRVEVTIRRAKGAAAEELRERQLRAVLRLLQRAAALQAEARRAA